MKKLRYYLSHIVTFLLIVSINVNIFDWLLKDTILVVKDIIILMASFSLSFWVTKYHYTPGANGGDFSD